MPKNGLDLPRLHVDTLWRDNQVPYLLSYSVFHRRCFEGGIVGSSLGYQESKFVT